MDFRGPTSKGRKRRGGERKEKGGEGNDRKGKVKEEGGGRGKGGCSHNVTPPNFES